MCHAKAAPVGGGCAVRGRVCGQCGGGSGRVCGLPRAGVDRARGAVFAGPRGGCGYCLASGHCPGCLQAPEAGPPPHARAHGGALPGPDSRGTARAGAVPHYHAAAQRRAGAGRRGPHPQRDAQAGQRRRLCGAGRRQHPKQHRAHRRRPARRRDDAKFTVCR